MTTGERIKAARLNKGLTQEELGKMIGVQRAAINKYESGAVVNLKRSTIAKLATALGVKGSWLICADEESSDGALGDKTKAPTLVIEDERTIEFINLFSQLSEAEQDIFLAQIKGVLASR